MNLKWKKLDEREFNNLSPRYLYKIKTSYGICTAMIDNGKLVRDTFDKREIDCKDVIEFAIFGEKE